MKTAKVISIRDVRKLVRRKEYLREVGRVEAPALLGRLKRMA